MLKLPDVTLVTTAGVCHALARAAMMDSMKGIEFAEVVTFADRPLDVPSERWVKARWEGSAGAAEFIWHQAHKHIETTHMLYCQWDSWVLRPDLWNSKWLETDYIGAPWPENAPYVVGNGGFTLWSRRLLRFLAENKGRFPLLRPWEDSRLSRYYRPVLEREHGFRWPTTQEAERFSFENRSRLPGGSFGFHAMYNWPKVISEAAMIERLKLFDSYAKASTTLNRLPAHLLRYIP